MLFMLIFPGYTTRDVYSDIAYAGSPDDISSGSYLPTNSFGPWEEAYKKIAIANKV